MAFPILSSQSFLQFPSILRICFVKVFGSFKINVKALVGLLSKVVWRIVIWVVSLLRLYCALLIVEETKKDCCCSWVFYGVLLITTVPVVCLILYKFSWTYITKYKVDKRIPYEKMAKKFQIYCNRCTTLLFILKLMERKNV